MSTIQLMTPDELYRLIGKRKVMLFRGQVFFNTRSQEEMREWSARGAHVVPYYTLDEPQSKTDLMGWEIHVLGLLDPEWVAGLEEEDVDVAPENFRDLVRLDL